MFEYEVRADTTRICEQCYEEFVYIKKTELFCSKECKQQHQYDKNKNPLSLNVGVVDFPNDPGYNENYRVPPEILAQAELYADCAEEANNGYTAYIQEDIEDLHMILRSEYALSSARYEKRQYAKYSGKSYWEAKLLRNYQRKKKGVPELKSIRHHNFQRKLDQWHKEKRGEVPKLKIPTETEVQNPGFATITPMKTKSGKSIAEILDNVQRKKSVGST